MTIVPLERVTLVGLRSQKDNLLNDLQVRGCSELIPLTNSSDDGEVGNSPTEAYEALKYLLSCPHRRRQATDSARFDVQAVERRALEVRDRAQQLANERDDLVLRLDALRPFGKFEFPPPEAMGRLRLWFYVVPHREMAKLDDRGLTYEVAGRDSRNSYVVVVSPEEPQSMPVPRAHVGSRSADELARRLEDVELAIEDAQAERAYLSRWCLLFAQNLAQLENQAARERAGRQTLEQGELFALQAWVPRQRVPELAEFAARNEILFESHAPAAAESPPTWMQNRRQLQAGEDLVNFYMTPAYSSWDPSAIVFVSFALFFAMIMADAGYAAILGAGVLVYWRRLGRSGTGLRFRPMLALIILLSLIYGVLVGSYFGLTPSRNSLLGRLHLLDMSNSKLMMGISILVGGIHVALANVMDSRRYSDWRDRLPSLGWASAVIGGLVYGAGVAIPAASMLTIFGAGTLGIGLVLVVAFTAWREKPLRRVAQGLFGLTKISAAFGDVLSYLRLFALGLASASLAVAFNDMAAGIHRAVPRLGLVLAVMILAFGHALNLLLGVSSGVIHGLRLNVIEFFNWGLKDEGRRIALFRQKEGSL